ncbi:Xylulose-5-phosphate phosphoketolase [Streptomyces sp. ADI95-17]|nr:Xylulose-5-phosphate phosphoketolase [Streptomyces sp. ADI95-17]
MLAHLGPLTSGRPPGSEVLVVHGAGHAGPSALAHAYLTKALALPGHGPGWSADGLRALAAGFPHTRAYGGEITPLIPGVRYTGGQLGPALAVAQGMVLDAPHRLVVALLGDGELETGAAAAAWTARRALFGSGLHGAVLPVVLANGLRMGGPSVLAGLDEVELRAYFTGLGYEPFLHDGSDMAGFRTVLAEVFARLRPLGAARPQPVLVLTMPKGATGPDHVAGRQITGAPAVRKTPLKDPARNREEFDVLASWLGSYGPGELFTESGQPSGLVRQALPHEAPRPSPAPPVAPLAARGAEACPLVSTVIRERAAAGAFRLFSPDEAASNRLRLAADDEDDRLPAWASEILNEEICHAWLQGYTETGRDALLATYEAFAAVNTSLLVQHLKHRSARTAAGGGGLANINYLITSLGWRNTCTHQNPGLVSAMLETQNPTVHVYTPADATRAAAVLAVMLAGRDRANFLIADKHKLRSRISTGLGTCGSNRVPARVIYGRSAHEGRASRKLGDANLTEQDREALVSLLYASEHVQFNSAAPSCDCLAHVYSNAADHPDRERGIPQTCRTRNGRLCGRCYRCRSGFKAGADGPRATATVRCWTRSVTWSQAGSPGGRCPRTSLTGAGSTPSSAAGASTG